VLAGLVDYQRWGGGWDLFAAQAIVTAPVIYTTAAGTGGPLLWNNSNANGVRGVNAHILAVSWAVTVAATAAGAIGWTAGTGQTTAPTTTTAIDGITNLNLQSTKTSALCNLYRIGTVSAAGAFFVPLGQVHTGALTTDTTRPNMVHLGGAIIIPPGGWFAVSASATLSTAVLQIGLWFAEVQKE
jgi:hypothetical protein